MVRMFSLSLFPSFSFRNVCGLLLVSMLLLGPGSGARAQTESLLPDVNYELLQKLIDTARINYPRVKSNAARLRYAQLQVQKERLSWFDVLTFSFLYSPNNSTTLVDPSFLNGYQVGLYIQFGRILQIPKSVAQAKQLLKVSEFDAQEYNLFLEAEVKSRYFTYLSNVAALRLFSSSANDASATVKMARLKYERGEARLEEYNSSLIVFAQQAQLKIQAEGTTLQTKARLEELLGKKLETIR